MNVVFLTEYFRPFEIGGAERSAERLGLELAKLGVAVCVITPNYGSAKTEDVDGLRIERLPFPQSLKPGQLARRIWSGNPFAQAVYAARIARRIRRDGYSLVHVQNSGMVIAGALAASRTRRPLVVTIRDLAYVTSDTAEPGHGLKWRLDAMWARGERLWKRRALRHARIIFVSRALLDLYVRQGIVDRVQSRVIYNIGPAPSSDEPFVREARSVLFVGKLSAGKGLGILYAAAELVARTLPDVRFELAGVPGIGFRPPPEAVAGRFTLHGRLEATEVRRLMLSRAVLVSPSVWPEPLSRVLLEAMACRLPIVATSVGGTTEMLEHERSALLVPAGDPIALAAALVKVLSSPDLARGLAAGATATLTSVFSPDAIVPQVLAAYRDAGASD